MELTRSIGEQRYSTVIGAHRKGAWLKTMKDGLLMMIGCFSFE